MKKISILEIYDTETDTRRVLHEFDGLIEAPNWLPDGDTLLYNANGSLYRFSISRGESRQLDLHGLNRCNNDHVVSADGTRIGFSCNPDADESWRSQIYLMPAQGGVPRQVTRLKPSFLHGISPDGGELAYCAFRDQLVDIYTIPSEGGEERRLTDGTGYNDGPEYSPDGQFLWFNSTRSGLMQIFRMNRDGSGLTQMTDTQSNNWFPHLSPDGKKVVYLAFRKGDLEPRQHLPDKQVELRLMDPDGSHTRTLVSLFGGQGTINVNSWAPDSRRFAFVSYRYGEG